MKVIISCVNTFIGIALLFDGNPVGVFNLIAASGLLITSKRKKMTTRTTLFIREGGRG